uniref:Putative secreted protein n=1 Tax=Anopheles marajoara TaxID=58244 RepID=A0A2M4CFE1_9DIPT
MVWHLSGVMKINLFMVFDPCLQAAVCCWQPATVSFQLGNLCGGMEIRASNGKNEICCSATTVYSILYN